MSRGVINDSRFGVPCLFLQLSSSRRFRGKDVENLCLLNVVKIRIDRFRITTRTIVFNFSELGRACSKTRRFAPSFIFYHKIFVIQNRCCFPRPPSPFFFIRLIIFYHDKRVSVVIHFRKDEKIVPFEGSIETCVGW